MVDEDEALARRRLGSVVGGKWALEAVLGSGGMGAVYRAREGSGQRAAIKVLHAALAHKAEVRERFLREGTLANQIAHPGALRILEHGSLPDGAGYLVMELLEGDTLSGLIRKEGPMPINELFGYLDQVLDVLVVAHGVGIIHRDLKPDNLFILASGQLKVLDFGLARRLADIQGDFKTKTGLALGTLPYMAPEQALGRRAEVDGRVDLFALGALAFRILARRKVHEAESEAELLMKMASEPAPRLGEVAPHLPRAVQAVVDTALAFSKEARYPDALTMQQDVRDLLTGVVPRHARLRQEQQDSRTRVEPTAKDAAPSQRRVPPTKPLVVHPERTEPMPVSQRLPPSQPARQAVEPHALGAPALTLSRVPRPRQQLLLPLALLAFASVVTALVLAFWLRARDTTAEAEDLAVEGRVDTRAAELDQPPPTQGEAAGEPAKSPSRAGTEPVRAAPLALSPEPTPAGRDSSAGVASSADAGRAARQSEAASAVAAKRSRASKPKLENPAALRSSAGSAAGTSTGKRSPRLLRPGE